MSTDKGFVNWCAELLSGLGMVRTRRMFGGHGFYVDDLFIALEMREVLYLKVDASTQPRFEAAGSHRFEYTTAQGGRVRAFDIRLRFRAAAVLPAFHAAGIAGRSEAQ